MDASSTRRTRTTLLAGLVAPLALLLAPPATSSASESNPNQYACLGHVGAGKPEAGSEEQQVQYAFYCNGPITGYQLESQVPLTGIAGNPVLSSVASGAPLTDVMSCSGEVPGYALNCVGAAKGSYENVTGQFAIGTKLCAEPRVDPLLTVTYAYLEKGVVTQAISGPFDLGRPAGCRPDGFSGGTRLAPKSAVTHNSKKHRHATKKKAKKAVRRH